MADRRSNIPPIYRSSIAFRVPRNPFRLVILRIVCQNWKKLHWVEKKEPDLSNKLKQFYSGQN